MGNWEFSLNSFQQLFKMFEKARSMNWIPDDDDACSRKTRILELARQSLSDSSVTMDAFFSAEV